MDKSKAGAHNIRCHGSDGAEVDGDNRYTRVTGALYMVIGVICTNTCAKHALRDATRCWGGVVVSIPKHSHPHTQSGFAMATGTHQRVDGVFVCLRLCSLSYNNGKIHNMVHNTVSYKKNVIFV